MLDLPRGTVNSRLRRALDALAVALEGDAMTREELERALHEAELPEEGAARERARRTVLAAHATRSPRGAPAHAACSGSRRSPRPAALVAAQLSPAQPFERIWRTSSHNRRPRRHRPRNGLELPARGKLLVTEGDALYVVEKSGKRRPLGAWQDATWSPKGLFVGVSAGNSLAAIDPDGDSRWRLRLPGPVTFPAGHPMAPTSPTAPAAPCGSSTATAPMTCSPGRTWPPSRPPGGRATATPIAWAARDGSITVEDADTAKVLWSFGTGARDPPRLVRRRPRTARGRQALVHGLRRRHGQARPNAAGPRVLDRGRGLRAARVTAGGRGLRRTRHIGGARWLRRAVRSGAVVAISCGLPTGAGCWPAGRVPTIGSWCGVGRGSHSRGVGGSAPVRGGCSRPWVVLLSALNGNGDQTGASVLEGTPSGRPSAGADALPFDTSSPGLVMRQ